jgi:uncharacterized MAPEG superfamily protein
MQAAALTGELQALAWSVVLLLIHVAAQGAASTASLGIGYNLGARDEDRQPSGPLASRLRRASANFIETYPAFIALALALAVSGKSGGMGATGAFVWLGFRVLYLPLYAFGVPVLRTLAWTGAMIGLLMMLTRLMS